ncbi:MAG: hypothetical protein P4L27_10810 [Ignavibacteriaceae bacterium]|nr:hypothetical protein [Ignavibacteriaceae bacterium]
MTLSQIKQQQENLVRLSLQYAQQDLDMVLLQNKNITYAGIQSLNHPLYAKCRVDLKSALNEFQLACAFLSQCKKSKAINKRNNSYHLKHKLERFVGMYISNGSIIAGAIALGIKYEVDGPNVWLAISKELPITDEVNEIAMAIRKSAA